jgi:hypothetical protein
MLRGGGVGYEGGPVIIRCRVGKETRIRINRDALPTFTDWINTKASTCPSFSHDMTTKPESHIPDHVVKDIEATEMEPEFADEAALALKRLATSDMAPITDAENISILKKIDLWMMPTVPTHPPIFVQTV